MLGGQKIKQWMLKAVWQDKKNVALNLLGEIAHYTLLLDKAGLMNGLSDPLKRQQPLDSIEMKMYQNASARVPTATMIKNNNN